MWLNNFKTIFICAKRLNLWCMLNTKQEYKVVVNTINKVFCSIFIINTKIDKKNKSKKHKTLCNLFDQKFYIYYTM